MAALFPAVGRQQPKLRLAWFAVIAVLAFGILMHLFTFWYMIVTSIKSGADTLTDAATLWPQHVSFAGWKLAWDVATSGNSGLLDYPFYVYVLNSLLIAVVTIALSIPITSLAAYANSKLQRGPKARWTFIFFIGTLFVPGVITLVPNLLLTHNFPFAVTPANVPRLPGGQAVPTVDFFDTPWACIIPGLFSAGSFLYFKAYFDTIPDSIIQAARVDGGAELNIFRRIVLPMCIPVYALAISGAFSAVWDGSFIWQSLVLQTPSKITTAVAIYSLEQSLQTQGTISNGGAAEASSVANTLQQMQSTVQAGLTWNGLMVIGILQTIPLFLVFIITAKYLLAGIRIRGLK